MWRRKVDMQSRFFNQDRIIDFPESRYKYVREPIGKIFKEDGLRDLIKSIRDIWFNGGYVASVGDRVTSTLTSIGIIPDIAVIDRMEMRRPVNIVDDTYFNRVYYGVNPKGKINLGLCRIIVEALKNHPSLIIISGEEDLVGFPVVLTLPIGSAFIYGMPKVGISFVYIDSMLKLKAYSLIRDIIEDTGGLDYG